MRNPANAIVIPAAVILALCVHASCTSPGRTAAPAQAEPAPAVATIPPPSTGDPTPRDYPGIHNAVAYHDGFISGSAPEGEQGFETLAAMGVRTIISVDGAEPDVAAAAAHGIRYVHLPIGYNGFDEERKLQLVRATRDAIRDSPVYMHCHHGKHRSAGAAAAVAVSLGWLTPDSSVARMHVSGTAPNYKGLYSCATHSVVLASHVIDAVDDDFPAVWKPTGFVRNMVETDEVYEHLKAIQKADWAAPADHPDLVPVAEAGRLADLFRLAIETEYVKRRPADFTEMLRSSQDAAQSLEDLLATAQPDAVKLEEHFKLITASCKDCHVKYRD